MMGGQSNMVGVPAYDGLGDYSADVMQLDYNPDTIPAVSPLQCLTINPNSMGLTVSFCERYLADNPNVKILLVPCALNGSSFSNSSWGVGNLRYEQMKIRTQQAMEAIPNTRLKGLLWHQGENDEGNTTYETELDAQMNDYKTFCSTYISDIPIILGQLAPAFVGTNPDRQAIQDIITDTPSRLTKSLVALSTDLTVFDGTHFDSASLRILGERYYEQYNNVITNAYEFIDGELYIDGEKWID